MTRLYGVTVYIIFCNTQDNVAVAQWMKPKKIPAVIFTIKQNTPAVFSLNSQLL